MSKKIVITLMILGFCMVHSLGLVLAEGKLILGVSGRTLEHPVHNIYGTIPQKMATEDGHKVIFASANDDPAKQLADIEDMLSQGANAFIIVPQNKDQIVPAIAKINAKGFPVAVIDTPASGGQFLFIGAHAYRSGQLSAEYIAKRLGGKGKVIILPGSPAHDVSLHITQGYEDVFSRYPDIKIVAKQVADWQTAKAMKITEDLLLVHPDVDAILANNDMMAIGAIEALKGAGYKPGDVLVTGGDGDKSALKLIKEGWLTCTIDKLPDNEAATAYKCIIEIFKGGAVPCNYSLKGAQILTETLLIDKTNVDERPGY